MRIRRQREDAILEANVLFSVPERPKGGAVKVLIVDDHHDTVQMLDALLRAKGYDTVAATQGAQAVDLAGSERPDVILLDIGLPRKQDGLTVCRHVRSEPWGEDTIIIALSGWTGRNDLEAALAAGCDYYLSKPVEFAELESLLGRGRRHGGLRAEEASRAGERATPADRKASRRD